MTRSKIGSQWYKFTGKTGDSVGVRFLGGTWAIYFRDKEGKPTTPTPEGGQEIAIRRYAEAKHLASVWLSSR